ncbi:MAG: PAS-domain containing protein, partial [Caulobacterales bacterium]|nr:PAS-domain containing protein [Caulobacterales bacterium]
MTADTPPASGSPLFAEFDADGALIAASDGFLGPGDDGAIEAYVSRFSEIDGDALSSERRSAAARWRAGGAALEARAADGEWRLLTSHPTAAGGLCLLSVDITRAKAGDRFARTMMERHPLPIWANDVRTGEVVFSNERAKEIFEADDDTYKTWRIGDFFVDPDDSLRILDDLKTRGRNENYVLRARSTTMREFWVSGAAALFEHEGRVIALSALQDVTTLKEHERESRRSLDLLNDALRSLTVAFALFDEDGRLVLCNDRFRELNAPIGAFVQPGVHWETMVREMATRRVARHAAGREAAWIAETLGLSEGFKPFEIARSDGAQIAVAVRPTSLGGFIVSQSDISDQREAERLARASEEMLSKILQASPANLCMSRIGDGEVIYQSPSCAALFGADASAKDQFADRGERGDFLTELLPSGRVDNYAATARSAEGRAFPALFSARVIDFKGEEVMVSTVTDLTDQHAARQALLDASTRLRDAIE